MSTENAENNECYAEVEPNRLISMVWFIPLLALIIGGWMLIQNIRTQGPVVTLHMPSADGIEVNKTVVKVLSVEVGRVTEINLKKDRTGVEVKLQLNAETKNLLKENTHFWVIKPRIDQSGIQGLGTLFSGAYIEFSPGTEGNDTYNFTVLPEPPIALTNQQGLRLHLESSVEKLIPAGNPVLYHNIIVGRIEKSEFLPQDQKNHYQIFIDKPFDSLVNDNVKFWITSGFDIKASPNGFKLRTGPLSTLLGGAISFTAKPGAVPGKAVASNSRFTLYGDLDQIEHTPSDRALYFVVLFDHSVRGLNPNAPVEYKGIRIGSVAQVPFFEKNESLKLFQGKNIPVLIQIDPENMELNAEKQDKVYWEKELNQAINKGLTARLQSNSLIMGGLYIDLSLQPNAPKSGAIEYAGHTIIPSISSGLDQIQDQITELLKKLNNLPLESSVKELNATLKEIRNLSASLNQVASSAETQNIPKELNQTLKDIKKTLQGVAPGSPLYGEAQKTLNSLNKTLEHIEPTVRTINEQPNSLIFNRSKNDPVPKGKK